MPKATHRVTTETVLRKLQEADGTHIFNRILLLISMAAGVVLAIFLGAGSVEMCRRAAGSPAVEPQKALSADDLRGLRQFLDLSARSAARNRLDEIEAIHLQASSPGPGR